MLTHSERRLRSLTGRGLCVREALIWSETGQRLTIFCMCSG